MPLIDFHTHIFPNDLAKKAVSALLQNVAGETNHTDGTLCGLLNSMDCAGITSSVTLPVATKPSQVSSINQTAMALASPKIISFGALHPTISNVKEVCARLSLAGFKGIKLHPEYQNFHVDDKALFPLYEACEVHKLIIVFHAGKDPGPFTSDHGLPHAFKKIITSFSTLTMVLAHMGGLEVWDDVASHIAGLPVYFDTSAVRKKMSSTMFMRLINSHGIDNILFGSDSPWDDQKACREWIEQMPMSSSEKEAILGGNAYRLLGN